MAIIDGSASIVNARLIRMKGMAGRGDHGGAGGTAALARAATVVILRAQGLAAVVVASGTVGG